MPGSDGEMARLGRHSTRLKFVRSLRRASDRRRERATILEGPHLFHAFLNRLSESPPRAADPAFRVRWVLFSDSYLTTALRPEESALLRERGVDCVTVSDRDFVLVSDTETPQGVAMVFETPPAETCVPQGARRVLVTDRVSDPGNLGTLIRSAAAFGFDAVMAAGGVDVFAPKVLRGSVGACFGIRLRPCDDANALLAGCREAGYHVAVTVIDDGDPPVALPTRSGLALVVGSESHGVDPNLRRHATHLITVPMRSGVASLNAAVAGSIVMYALDPNAR